MNGKYFIKLWFLIVVGTLIFLPASSAFTFNTPLKIPGLVIDFYTSFVNFFSNSNEVREYYFNQKLDHFNSSSTATWKQRYFNNNKFAKFNGIQFLKIGGEGTVSSYQLEENRTLLHWAKEVGANVWLLEHRFYGESQPFEFLREQEIDNFQYLNSQQALEDVANFIRTKNRQTKFRNNKWIVFGGSYPGALALWFRQKYPDLAIGAVGSSATVSIKLEYDRYFKIAEEVYKVYHPSCATNIEKGFEQLELYSNSVFGREWMNELFGNQFPREDLTYGVVKKLYIDQLADILTSAVQFNFPNKNNVRSIEEICEIMNAGSPYFKFTNLATIYKAANPDLFEEITTKKSDNFYKLFYFSTMERTDSRAWNWQVCTEQLSFVTSGSTIFGEGDKLNNLIEGCQNDFGGKYTRRYLEATVEKIEKIYGGNENYKGTNVVSTCGSIDPWKDLVLTKSNHPSVVTHMIDGASHCEDFHDAREDDSESLKKSREIILENIKKWIS